MEKKYLPLLFYRPFEPLFMPKGEERINFEIATDYLSEEHQAAAKTLQSRFGDDSTNSVKIPQIALPDLSVPLSLNRTENFSIFVPAHRDKAIYLTTIFLELRNVQDLLYVAASCRDRMNPQLFVYSLSTALLHRPDTKNVHIPQLAEIFPDKFIDSKIISKAKANATILPTGFRFPIEIPVNYTANERDPEHKIAYFREDIGVNLHHWHWHLVYPFAGPVSVVKKDRRGELLFYMHRQLVARYNSERLCNNLGLTRPLSDFSLPFEEAYFPKLDQATAGYSWPSRPANMKISDVNRPVDSIVFTLSDLKNYTQRIKEAMRTKTVIDTKGNRIPLDDFTGIDVLGNLMEACPSLSVNFKYYGDLHNMGHYAIAYCHDPDHRFLEGSGVMADSTTTMRDPAFYRWHQEVDNLFALYKDNLPAYNQNELGFVGVKIIDIGIVSKASNLNTLSTHWTKSDIDLSRGLDFAPRGAVLVRVQHLNHNPFTYVITANNSNNRDVWGTVRIFIAPKFDGTGRAFSFNEQRKHMIEMDKFTYKLKRGQNVIQRKSVDSSVTIPYESTFRNLEKDRPSASDTRALSQYAYCGCGWPQHMLVPKGTQNGFAMDLFVMISDYQQDKVEQSDTNGCRTGVSYCGLKDRKFPDARPMGFPFDRNAPVDTMNQFRTPNMMTQSVTVRFFDKIYKNK